MRIFHVTTAAEWDAAVAAGSYRRSTRGVSLDETGFIHLSDADQLPRVAEFAYRDAAEPLVVLELESDEVLAAGGRLVWEDGGGGEEFPHLYGPIDPSRVLTVWPAAFDAVGTFRWPPAGAADEQSSSEVEAESFLSASDAANASLLGEAEDEFESEDEFEFEFESEDESEDETEGFLDGKGRLAGA